jgi:hypothetical protein
MEDGCQPIRERGGPSTQTAYTNPLQTDLQTEKKYKGPR